MNEALANVVSNEEDDASVVAKISSGEADAGIVYTSDVSRQRPGTQRPGGDDPGERQRDRHLSDRGREGPRTPTSAQAFVTYVPGSEGQATLKTFGFGPPP